MGGGVCTHRIWIHHHMLNVIWLTPLFFLYPTHNFQYISEDYSQRLLPGTNPLAFGCVYTRRLGTRPWLLKISFRFPCDDLLSSFNVLSLRPINFLKSDELEEYGQNEIRSLCGHYEAEKTFTWKENGVEKELKSPSRHLMLSGYYSMNLWLFSNCFSWKAQ